MMIEPAKSAIREHFMRLYSAWGPQNWWPAQSRFEVIVGAILTQNTSWRNVERAIRNLRAARALTAERIREIPLAELEVLLRPSGYFRQKALRLKNFVAFLDQYYVGSLERMFAAPTEPLRNQLLELKGIGPETADSILLYAGNHEVFVVDAYTRRILERHQVVPAGLGYEQVRAEFEASLGEGFDALSTGIAGSAPRHPASRVSRLPRSAIAERYNQMHALIVRAGSQHCRTRPDCDGCPLQPVLPRGGPWIASNSADGEQLAKRETPIQPPPGRRSRDPRSRPVVGRRNPAASRETGEEDQNATETRARSRVTGQAQQADSGSKKK